MSNWMENKLTIYGKENDLNTFKKSVTSTKIKRDFIKTDDIGNPVYQESKVECMLDFNMIVPMPKEFEETEAPSEMIDKLGVYAEAGVDEIIISAGFGQTQKEMIDSMHRISEKVIPYFRDNGSKVS